MFTLYIHDYYYFTFFFSNYVNCRTKNTTLTCYFYWNAETTIYLCLYLIKHTIFYASEYNNIINTCMKICSPSLSPYNFYLFHYYVIITLFNYYFGVFFVLFQKSFVLFFFFCTNMILTYYTRLLIIEQFLLFVNFFFYFCCIFIFH